MMGPTERETFVWWEDHITGRVEWRYTCLEYGALLVTLHGQLPIHTLCVASWGTQQVVRVNARKVIPFHLCLIALIQ